MAEQPGASIVSATGIVDAELQGGYRFLENDYVDASALLDAGVMATVRAMESYSVILACEDSSVLSFNHNVEGAGGVGGPREVKTRGLWSHNTLALDASTGRTIGLLDQVLVAGQSALTQGGHRGIQVDL